MMVRLGRMDSVAVMIVKAHDCKGLRMLEVQRKGICFHADKGRTT
jgi:hypothetical protein